MILHIFRATGYISGLILTILAPKIFEIGPDLAKLEDIPKPGIAIKLPVTQSSG